LLAFLAEANVAPAPTPPRVTLNFVGDLMLARGVLKSAQARGRTKADWNGIFSSVSPELENADLTLGNLESPLTTRPFKGPSFDLRAPLEAVGALGPFDVLSIVNNHAQDGGVSGLEQSRQTLRNMGKVPLEGQLWTKTLRGRTFGFLAFLDEGTANTLEPIWDSRLEQVKKVASQVEFLTVFMHWGAEYSLVTSRQRTLAAALEHAGAKLVVGAGPHVLQPVQKLGRAWVAYSLGNFVFDASMPSARVGAILKVRVTRDLLELSALPTRTRGGRVFKAEGIEARNVLERLKLPPIYLGPTAAPPGPSRSPSPPLPTVKRPQTNPKCPTLTLPQTWDVRSSAWGDLTGDGLPECALTVWRPWRGWKVEQWGPKRKSPVGRNRDARGDSSNIVLVRPLANGKYREVWAGSPLVIPVLRAWLEDTNSDGKLKLVALEGNYAAGRTGRPITRAVWRWKPFGFELVSRVRLK